MFLAVSNQFTDFSNYGLIGRYITGPNINPQIVVFVFPTEFTEAGKLRSDYGIPRIRIVGKYLGHYFYINVAEV